MQLRIRNIVPLQVGNEKGANSLEAQVLIRNAYSSASNLDPEIKGGLLMANDNGLALHNSTPELNGLGLHHVQTVP